MIITVQPQNGTNDSSHWGHHKAGCLSQSGLGVLRWAFDARDSMVTETNIFKSVLQVQILQLF